MAEANSANLEAELELRGKSRVWSVSSALPIIALVAAKSAATLLVLQRGFQALSDDDFARVAIAQQFARAPSLDPSGTSWLPFPFWLNGIALGLFGNTYDVARATAAVSGVVAALLLFTAARWLGASRASATLGGALGSLFPYAAWLGVATVPEELTAALVVLGAASLRSSTPKRWLGALALSAACLSRYEAWPAAFVFAACTGWDALRERRLALSAIALVALSGPIAWLLHGVFQHGDPLFFVSRVAEYRRALHGGTRETWRALYYFPLAVLRCEPELMGLFALALGLSRFRQVLFDFERYRRFGLVLGTILLFVVVGDLRDGAPTHHAERAVLALWMGVAIITGELYARAFSKLGPVERGALGLASLCLAGLISISIRPWYARRDSFIDRSHELAVGEHARRLASNTDQLLIDTDDYGFYAVMVGFQAPLRARALRSHDPRQPKNLPFTSADALRQHVLKSRANWLIVTRSHQNLAQTLGKVRYTNQRFALLELVP